MNNTENIIENVKNDTENIIENVKNNTENDIENIIENVKNDTENIILEPKTLDEYVTILNTYSGVIVVDFYATWCKPCKKIYPTYIKLANKYSHFTFLKMNISNLEFDGIIASVGVKKYPSFAFFKEKRFLKLLTGGDMEGFERELMIRSI
jgi:thioredoxin 1